MSLLVISELYASGSFEWMKKSVDEEEHSIEMQLPYIEKMMSGYAKFSVKFH
jgi:predicted class III extradiol MEMO1 family dioxygenase